MLFNSIEYIVFFPACVSIYFLLPHRARWAFLLAASYFFYAHWNPKYLVLIVASTLVDYVVGIGLMRTRAVRWRRALLVASLTCNLGLLFTFKYFNFAVDTARSVLAWTGIEIYPPELQFLLPVGISFYTFQTLSYTIDVYTGKRNAESHLGVFALYVAFFPQLVAGPIERSVNLLPQFFEKHRIQYDLVTSGLRLILWGMFKKVVVADNLAVVVDACFTSQEGGIGPITVLGTVFFAYQIYCDFSGYSDIAIGSARVMGFDLMTNFNRPYHADSFTEFWRRWHISLSSWFRDYVYIPLGGNRVGLTRWAINISAVFVLSGVWHGANLTFICWGALHAIYYLSETVLGWYGARGAQSNQVRLPRAVRTFIVFVFTCVAWIFFRAESVSHAGNLILSLGWGWGQFVTLVDIRALLQTLGLSLEQVLAGIAYIVFLELFEWKQVAGMAPRLLNTTAWLPRWLAYAAVTLGILNLGAGREINFIYFQF